jgi:RNA polymerase sigma factor (sigma-70 family)
VTIPRQEPETPDAELIGRFLAGNEPAFRALYLRHTPRLKTTLARLLGAQRHDVDDMVQDTWLSASRALRGFRGEAKFSTWLTSIGVRITLAHLARHRRHESEPLCDVPALENGGVIAQIDAERLLAQLPEHQRVVVVLHDLEGFTHEEIGAQLGIAVGTSKVTLFRARAALRNAFGPGVTNGC